MYFYIYFYYINQDIVYIGKTNNLYRRYKEHSRKEFMSRVTDVSFTKLKSKIDMDMYEIYYINKYKPKYNVADKNRGEPTFVPVSEPRFQKKSMKSFLKFMRNKEISNEKKLFSDKDFITQKKHNLPIINETEPNLLYEMYKKEKFSVVYKEKIYSLFLYTEKSSHGLKNYDFDKKNQFNSLVKNRNKLYFDALFSNMVRKRDSSFEVKNDFEIESNEIEFIEEDVNTNNNEFINYRIKPCLHPILVVNFDNYYSIVGITHWKEKEPEGKYVLKKIEYISENINKILI